MYNDNNNDIVQQLKKETDEVTELKEMTWEKIRLQIPLKEERNMKKRRKNRVIAIAAMAIVIAFIWAGLTTPTGSALIQNLKDMFIPDKTVEIDIEGGKEETHIELETNEELRYVIYVDTSRYKLIEGETSDKIVMLEELEADYPEVSMEIIRAEMTEAEAVDSLEHELNDLDMNMTTEEIVTPLEGTLLHAIGEGYTNEFGKTGTQWDTPVYEYFVTKEHAGQVFIIKQKYFLEAAEGHGVRFDAMLESFEIVE